MKITLEVLRDKPFDHNLEGMWKAVRCLKVITLKINISSSHNRLWLSDVYFATYLLQYGLIWYSRASLYKYMSGPHVNLDALTQVPGEDESCLFWTWTRD